MNQKKEWGKDQREQGQIIATFVGTVKHYFGEWREIFKGVKDGRNPAMITYPIEELMFTGVLMYLCHLGSRRDINYKLRGNESAPDCLRQVDLEDGSRLVFRWMNGISYTHSNFDQGLSANPQLFILD